MAVILCHFIKVGSIGANDIEVVEILLYPFSLQPIIQPKESSYSAIYDLQQILRITEKEWIK